MVGMNPVLRAAAVALALSLSVSACGQTKEETKTVATDGAATSTTTTTTKTPSVATDGTVVNTVEGAAPVDMDIQVADPAATTTPPAATPATN